MRHGDAIGIEATPDQSEFFYRDRGRPMTKVFHPTIRDALEAITPAAHYAIEYVYLFGQSEWAVMFFTENGFTEPMPVTPETMAGEIFALVEPEFQDGLIETITEGDPIMAERLKARAQNAAAGRKVSRPPATAPSKNLTAGRRTAPKPNNKEAKNADCCERELPLRNLPGRSRAGAGLPVRPSRRADRLFQCIDGCGRVSPARGRCRERRPTADTG